MPDAYRWACAVVRLAKLESHGEVTLSPPGFCIEMRQRPVCRCCGDPLDCQKWLDGIVRGYEFELAWLLATARDGGGVLAPPLEGESRQETK